MNTEENVMKFVDKVLDLVNASKVTSIIAMNALMRVACLIAIQCGSNADGFVKEVRETFEKIEANRNNHGHIKEK